MRLKKIIKMIPIDLLNKSDESYIGFSSLKVR